jgi:hypothetical protein
MSQSIFALLLFVIALAFKGGIALNILTAGNALFGNQTQYLSNSGYYLVMQPDCTLVMYQGSSLATSHRVWGPTAGKGSDCWLTMQTDGNLVVNNATCDPPCIQWESNTYMFEGNQDQGFFLMLKSNGELDMYNFQNDNPILYKTIVSNPLDPTGSPPLFNVSLATTPTLSFYGPYMAIGYHLPKMSTLQNGPFSLTLGTNCSLQSKNTLSNTVLWETPSNADVLQCELTLQQDGNLQIQTNDTNEILWTTNTTGDSSVNWVLYIDSTTGNLSIGDILLPTDILWKNTFSSNPPIGSNYTKVPNPNTQSGKRFILELLGVSGIGGFLLGITSLVLTYSVYTRFIDPARKELQQRLQNSGGKCQALTLTQIKG